MEGTMEYALQGYGYSIARVVRSELARRKGEHEQGFTSMDRVLSTLLDDSRGDLPESLLERMLKPLLKDYHLQSPPELLSSLRAAGPPGEMNNLMWRVASATKAAFDALRRVMELRLTICSLEKTDRGDEDLLLGVYSPSLTADVRVNDPVSAGVMVALHTERGGGGCRLEVVPRVYRKVCQNGTIVFVENAPAREFAQALLWKSEALELLMPELARMIHACLDANGFALTVSGFRRAAAEPLDDAALGASLGGHLSPEVERAVLTRYRASGEFTRWGLLNAVTAEARTAPSALMLNLERLAGALTARVATVGAHSMLMGYSPQLRPQPLKKPAAA
jgi:hypothetical protein